MNPDQIVLTYIRETSRVLKPSGVALLHFRITPSPSPWKSFLLGQWLKKRKEKSIQQKGFWWNKGIKKASLDYQTTLFAEFGEKEVYHAWFTAFAPYDNPRIALAVLVERGGEGSDVSVPIAKKILEWYFANRME